MNDFEEWEDLIWRWVIADTTKPYGLKEWGTILDGVLKSLSTTVDLLLGIHNVKYDLNGEFQGVNFIVDHYPQNDFHTKIVGRCRIEMIETDGKREFKGTVKFFYFHKDIRLVGENGETYLLYEILRTENGKTTWKPVGWKKDETRNRNSKSIYEIDHA